MQSLFDVRKQNRLNADTIRMSLLLSWISFRSIRSQMFFKSDVLKNFANFTGKHLCWSLNFIKKRLQHRRFPMKFAKFLRTPILQNTSCGCFFRFLHGFSVDDAIYLSSHYRQIFLFVSMLCKTLK